MSGERVRAAFREGGTALLPYLTGGYPSLEGAREVGEAFLEAGADVLEIGQRDRQQTVLSAVAGENIRERRREDGAEAIIGQRPGRVLAR